MSEGDSAPHEHYLYNVDERVLCFHGPLIYEAKASDKKGCYRQVHVDSNDLDLEPWVVRRRSRHSRCWLLCSLQGLEKHVCQCLGVWEWYFEHGYANELLLFDRWDEWVPESRVLRLNDTNLAMQSKLKDLYTVWYTSNIKYSSNLSHLIASRKEATTWFQYWKGKEEENSEWLNIMLIQLVGGWILEHTRNKDWYPQQPESSIGGWLGKCDKEPAGTIVNAIQMIVIDPCY